MQNKFTNLADATENAISVSKETGYAFLIESRGAYYVEDETPFIRNYERLVAEYDNGEIVINAD